MNLTAGENYLEIDGSVSITNAQKVVKKKSRNIVIIVEDNGNTNEIPLLGTFIDGTPAANIDEIYEFVKPLVFNNGGGGGSGATGVNVVSNDSLPLDKTGYYTYTGDTNISQPLPDVADTEGTRYVILNTVGTGSITLEGNIYEGGMIVEDFVIGPGENYIIYNNGLHWAII